MAKFLAMSLDDLKTAERNAGRVKRDVYIIVACEASDGSWCEFDADGEAHARVLADNAVDNFGARGCSAWYVIEDTGELKPRSFYTVFAPHNFN